MSRTQDPSLYINEFVKAKRFQWHFFFLLRANFFMVRIWDFKNSLKPTDNDQYLMHYKTFEAPETQTISLPQHWCPTSLNQVKLNQAKNQSPSIGEVFDSHKKKFYFTPPDFRNSTDHAGAQLTLLAADLHLDPRIYNFGEIISKCSETLIYFSTFRLVFLCFNLSNIYWSELKCQQHQNFAISNKIFLFKSI